MHRRSFLRAATATAAGLTLTACGGDGEDAAGAGTEGAGGADVELPASGEQGTLFVQAANLELLTGPDRWLALGVVTTEMSPLDEDRPVTLHLRQIPTTEASESPVVVGPLETTFSPATETGQGVYYTRADLEEPGFYEFVAVSEGEFGTAAVQVVDPQESQVKRPDDQSPVVPGSMAIAAPTATTEDDRGVFSICTQQPEPCGMHEMSLDQALETGRPVALMFATPQFCQTAVCGPSVATLDAIRADGDWGDTIFIHSEIYAEEPSGTPGQGAPAVPVVDAVAAWGLPTEPWFFGIAADGTIQSRLDGPMPEPILRDLLEQLTA